MILPQFGSLPKLSLSMIKPIAYRFCNAPYFMNKQLQQREKISTLYKHDPSKLKTLQINMKQLSPNFFTQSLPLFEALKTILPSKEFNRLDNSYIALTVPLSSVPQMQTSLRKFSTGEVRIGRMMELMDSVAGLVGYRHCFGSLSQANSFILVTGSVDSINLFEGLTISKDIKIQGYISSVGSTSMEVEINIIQEDRLKCNALFTMISRNAQDPSKPHPCPQLSLDGLSPEQLSKAEKRRQDGENNKQRRRKQIAKSYQRSPPSAEDSKLLHEIFLSTRKREERKNDIVIEQTSVNNTLMMHIEERNVHNKIFGGYLMRQMLDTAWITTNRFTMGKPFRIEDITNIYFLHPVEIGDELRITAKVAYTHENILVLNVQAYVFNFTSKVDRLCCECHYFMKTNSKQPAVYPLTYENGIHFLSSKNAFNKIFHSN